MSESLSSPLVARDARGGRWIRLVWEAGGSITSVEPAEGSVEPRPDDPWVHPAFWDIQTNGRHGISFSDATLTVDQVARVVRDHGALGTARLCPTLITASREATRHGVATIAEACDRFPDIAARIVGIHLEGPYISSVDGYRGAHPIEHARDPDWSEFEVWQAASGHRIVLTTLAPERPGSLDFIRRAVGAGIVVALGHTAADGPTLSAAVAAGATLSTHLGNGIAATLPRHPNAIWRQAADDRLAASFIADGHHLDADTLRVLVRSKTPARTILVSDASPLAGLPVGDYGPWSVDASGKIVVAGTPYLAGSNQPIEVGVNALLRDVGLALAAALAAATDHPARLLGRPVPRLETGAPACFIVFHHDPSISSFHLLSTVVDGVEAA